MSKQQFLRAAQNQHDWNIAAYAESIEEEKVPSQGGDDVNVCDDKVSAGKVLDIEEWNRKQQSKGAKPRQSDQPEMVQGASEQDQKRADNPLKPANQPLSKKQKKQLMIQKQQENARAAALARQQEAMRKERENREREKLKQEQQLKEQALLEE